MKANLSGRVAVVTLPIPIRPKGSARWALKASPVAIYPGETEADARAFVAAITQSFEARFGRAQEVDHGSVRAMRRHVGRRNAVPTVSKPQAPMSADAQGSQGRTCCGRTFRRSGVGYAWHVEHVHAGVAA